MAHGINEYGELICPICGKKFIPPPETIYKTFDARGVLTYFCSYTCYRVPQKEKEKAKAKRRERSKASKYSRWGDDLY